MRTVVAALMLVLLPSSAALAQAPAAPAAPPPAPSVVEPPRLAPTSQPGKRVVERPVANATDRGNRALQEGRLEDAAGAAYHLDEGGVGRRRLRPGERIDRMSQSVLRVSAGPSPRMMI